MRLPTTRRPRTWKPRSTGKPVAHPHPGDLPHLNRLTRTEYQNAVRDLLGVDHLPKEMDYSLLLPADNSSSEFDNIADLLFISPSTMQRYLDAARKISRLAVGDPNMPVMVNIHRLPVQMPQDARVEDLPFGTRGGLAVNSYFPLDADYVFKVEMAGYVRQPEQVEVTVDGERKELAAIGGGARVSRGSKPLEFRLPVKAGPRLVGVTFVLKTEALDEATVRPRTRGRGTLPAIGTVTISGPFNPTGPGDTPSRRKIFVCQPGRDPRCRAALRQTDSLHSGRPGLPPSGNGCRPARSAAVLPIGTRARHLRTWH